MIADIFNKQEQAHSWIQQHKLKCEEFWTHFSVHKGNHQSATIFVLAEGSLYIMGMKGFGLTIYHPLAFQPSEKVKELIETKLPFRMIQSHQTGEYRADVHFLLVDEDPLSKQEAVRIMHSRFWKSLSSNQAYVTEAKWNFDDPITMDQLLIQLPRILQTCNI
ncbi:hypothetical protein [Paenibacillus donghaensis]|uniref:Uncharacterized protein n=1 Tax=Paenibacillus donghaensis TaxID=414771 RepID=A0A2Z2KG45_9BACL|nr:hypothetical protein [Paenibacillus donghaensis]ASA25144.1 hypothetical protein B9T62_33055 [Paenibacillus donghaensis]